MNKKLREDVQGVSKKALAIIKDYFAGNRTDSAQVKEAIRMVGFGLKVEHMDQLSSQNDRSIALRLLKFLPEVDKQEYIRITNPQIAPLLLKKPEKK